MSCFVQTCDQTITGRNFEYPEALSLIQNEDYLDDADIDELRRQDDIIKGISEFNPEVNIRQKRHITLGFRFFGHGCCRYDAHNIGAMDVDYINNGCVTFDECEQECKEKAECFAFDIERNPFDAVANPMGCIDPEHFACSIFYGSGDDFLPSLHLGATGPGGPCSGKEKCFARVDLDAVIDDSPPKIEDKEKDKEKTDGLFGMGSGPAEVAVQAAAVLGIGMLGTAMMAANPNFQEPGSAPPGSPLVGSFGGGGSPRDSQISTSSLSLVLVPLGLLAVAVFPPFESPRTFPAVGVIFSEPRNVEGTVLIRKRETLTLYRGIKKRSLWQDRNDFPTHSEIAHALKSVNSNKRSVLTKAWTTLQRFRVSIAKKMYNTLPTWMKEIVKKIERFEAKLNKKIICLKPRLERKYGRLIYPEGLTVKSIIEHKQNFLHEIKYGDPEDDKVDYIEDCFKDMERPKFGWSVKVTLMEDEPCDFNNENPELGTCRLDAVRNNASSSDLNRDNAQRRQTLEEFRSAAPTDCRIRYIC